MSVFRGPTTTGNNFTILTSESVPSNPNSVARYSDETGLVIKDSLVTIDDAGKLTAPSIEFDTLITNSIIIEGSPESTISDGYFTGRSESANAVKLIDNSSSLASHKVAITPLGEPDDSAIFYDTALTYNPSLNQMTMGELLATGNGIRTNTIVESTLNAGVSIESIKLENEGAGVYDIVFPSGATIEANADEDLVLTCGNLGRFNATTIALQNGTNSLVTSASNVDCYRNFRVDTMTERTLNAGVTIESIKLENEGGGVYDIVFPSGATIESNGDEDLALTCGNLGRFNATTIALQNGTNSLVTSASNVDCFRTFRVDTINERTLNAGVTVDGCLIRNGGAAAIALSTATSATNYLTMSESTGGEAVPQKVSGSLIYDATTTTLRTGKFLTNEVSPPANPEFSFVGDPDTGLKWAGTNALFLQANGNAIVQADDSAIFMYRPVYISGQAFLYNAVGLDGPVSAGFFNQTDSKVLTAPLGALTTIIGTGNGTTTVPANSLNQGSCFRIKNSGVFTVGGNQTWEIDVQINGTSIIGGLRTYTGNLAVNDVYDFEIDFTIRTIGAGGTLMFNGIFEVLDAGTVKGISLANVGTTAIDTTIANTLDIKMRPQTGGTSLTSQITTIQKTY